MTTCNDVTEADWPNCSVPDCEYKACLSANSDRCYGHTYGLPIIPFEEYMNAEPAGEEGE